MLVYVYIKILRADVSSDFSGFEWESLAMIRVSEYTKERKYTLLLLANVVSLFLYTRRYVGVRIHQST